MVEVRRARPEDARRLAELRYEFRTALNPASESREAFVERSVPWMTKRLGKEGPWRCWVVEDSGKIVGHLWLQLIEKIPNPGPELELIGYVTNVYVSPSARGSGAGGKLVEAAMSFCRDAGVDSVVLWPTERSRTLYARYGFREPDDILEAVLDTGRELH